MEFLNNTDSQKKSDFYFIFNFKRRSKRASACFPHMTQTRNMKQEIHRKQVQHAQMELREKRQREERETRREERDKGKKEGERSK
jgi:hypothetical protein